MAEQALASSPSSQKIPGDWPVQRCALRVHLPVAVNVTGAGLTDTGNVALLRDISSAGEVLRRENFEARTTSGIAMQFRRYDLASVD